MTSIPSLPDPSLLTGASASQVRSALTASRLATLLPLSDVPESGMQSTSGGTVEARGLGQATAAGTPGGPLAAGGSTRETLSWTARTILDLVERTDGTAVRGGQPLLPAAPAGAAAAATLRSALTMLVNQSGMFYESHLAQWFNGARSLDALRQEPQGRLPAAPRPDAQDGAAAGTTAQAAQAAPAATPDARPAPPVLLLPAPTPTPAPADAAARPALPAGETLLAAQPDGDTDAASHSPPRPAQPDGHAAQPGAAAPRPGNLAAEAYAAVARGTARPARELQATGSDSAAQPARAGVPDAQEAARGAAPIIHPASENLVRQQLDLLASQQFRWTGEAWPGVPLDWEIQPQTWDDTGGGATDRAWSTRLRLTLPNLGEVEARLSLHGTGLQALLLTPDRAVATRLNAERSALAGNLSANGLVLMRLDVEALRASTQEAAP
ncbi:hypothetical protein BKK79_22725 [Cupriavidus sp. USMAA2-4]|uniref:flagellar hook-length control protein FliK n=1 Tax=Cupriavidus sp. USMAA2-4 TaxID=876364 RepID=UPI0008A6B1EB|nr:flagellar hook-length control protein FliK [Cupriavidus sp. USMAA2-4]AOY94716.1 hypothetical protein BKK79_22725 [Cupriavidus sp. USMAA2-4]